MANSSNFALGANLCIIKVQKQVKPPTFVYGEVNFSHQFSYFCPFFSQNLAIFVHFWLNLVAHQNGQVSVRAL